MEQSPCSILVTANPPRRELQETSEDYARENAQKKYNRLFSYSGQGSRPTILIAFN